MAADLHLLVPSIRRQLDTALERAAACGWAFEVTDVRAATASASASASADRFTVSIPYCAAQLRYDVIFNAAALAVDPAVPPDIVALDGADADAPVAAAIATAAESEASQAAAEAAEGTEAGPGSARAGACDAWDDDESVGSDDVVVAVETMSLLPALAQWGRGGGGGGGRAGGVAVLCGECAVWCRMYRLQARGVRADS